MIPVLLMEMLVPNGDGDDDGDHTRAHYTIFEGIVGDNLLSVLTRHERSNLELPNRLRFYLARVAKIARQHNWEIKIVKAFCIARNDNMSAHEFL